MLDIKLIREHPDLVRKGVASKGYDPKLIDVVLNLDEKKRQLMSRTESLHAERNKLSKDQIETGKKIKEELKQIEPQLAQLDQEFQNALDQIPNLPAADVPLGKSEDENVDLRHIGVPRKFDFPIKDHVEIGKELNILDFETGAKVSGSHFYYLYGAGAMLELALTQFALNMLSQEGFTPVITPDLAKSRYYLGTGYLPKGDEAQTYKIEGEDLGLIATAEVTLAGRHADETILEDKLPIKYVGYSHCFRQERGAYGKYSHGLYRVHQFTKAEMFIYCLPEDSEKYHQHLLAMEEKIYQALDLPYRVLQQCTSDLGAMAAKKYDIEVWMPGRGDYGEVTSTSNCTDYQARNLNIKFKRKNGQTGYVHMLNGTAIASSRTPLAILENYQNPDGSVAVPEVLRKYMGKDKIT